MAYEVSEANKPMHFESQMEIAMASRTIYGVKVRMWEIVNIGSRRGRAGEGEGRPLHLNRALKNSKGPFSQLVNIQAMADCFEPVTNFSPKQRLFETEPN